MLNEKIPAQDQPWLIQIEYFQFIHFIDEAHFDSDDVYSKRTLRKENIRYESQNMQIMLDIKGVKLHFRSLDILTS